MLMQNFGVTNKQYYESEERPSQQIFQLKKLERRNLKKSGLQRDSNPWPPRYRCVALPTELWSHTLGARSIIEFISPVRSEMVRSIYEIIHFWTAVVDESEERPSQQVGKFAAMVVLHFHLQPQFKNELFHIYFANSIMVCYGISGVVNCKLSFFLPPRLQSTPESLLAGYSPWQREEFKRPAIPLPTKNITKKETAWFCW